MFETVVPGGSLWQSPCGCGCHVVDPFDEPQVGDPVERDDLRRLWGLRAGAGLHAALEMVEIDVPGEVDEAGLLEVAAGAERAVAALRAIQVRALAELAARRSQVDAAAIAEAPPGRRPLEPCTADEVAARLRWTSATANRRVDEAVHLVTALPRTLDLLALGEIDEARARVVVRGTEHLSAQAASLVDAAVQERAPAVTTSRLRRLVSAAALQVDPRGAEERAEQVRDRSAVWSVPAEDGACLLSAVAPAAEVADVLDALDGAARDARERGEVGEVGRLRWEALLGWARGSRSRRRRAGASEQVGDDAPIQVNVAATTLLGLDDDAAVLVGYGPIPAGLARRLAARGTWRRVLVDPRTGVAVGVDSHLLPAGWVAAGGPGGSGPCDDDPPGDDPSGNGGGSGPSGGTGGGDPGGGGGGSGGGGGGDSSPGPRSPAPSPRAGPVPARARAPSPPTVTPQRLPPDGPPVQVPAVGRTFRAGHPLAPASAPLTVTGGPEHPVNPPATPCPMAGGRDYRPGRGVSRLVRLRHRTCCAPGCSRAAQRCDLDHVVRFPDGPTCPCNLRPLCRRHHRMKHEGGWSLRALSDGGVEWTAPTGHRYRLPPEAFLPRLRPRRR